MDFDLLVIIPAIFFTVLAVYLASSLLSKKADAAGEKHHPAGGEQRSEAEVCPPSEHPTPAVEDIGAAEKSRDVPEQTSVPEPQTTISTPESVVEPESFPEPAPKSDLEPHQVPESAPEAAAVWKPGAVPESVSVPKSFPEPELVHKSISTPVPEPNVTPEPMSAPQPVQELVPEVVQKICAGKESDAIVESTAEEEPVSMVESGPQLVPGTADAALLTSEPVSEVSSGAEPLSFLSSDVPAGGDKETFAPETSLFETLMAKEELEEEKRVQLEQLAAIFQLLQEKQEVTAGEMEEQLHFDSL
ncbi:E3 ubiquitin-protein ligase RNF12-B-like isoform X2 [Thalassophryne amazonica]|uniref:E3 ubiquitin-protein ligase RNF12-B-like isoform X2 n=1 Tax=Thalassophryne amazonica TaxID=390379 RepID=UPI00147140F2|nr:E3 ubiquitin-protein ligase RNF12-B-like isoform X2 [Thalassophryne amazonica]